MIVKFILIYSLYYLFKSKSLFKFAKISECGDLTQLTCQDYLRMNPNLTNLTVTNMIESKQITLSYGLNYITSNRLNISLVKKGFVPMIRLISGIGLNNVYMITKKSNSLYSDYVGFNGTLSNGTFIEIRNLTTVKSYLKSTYSNIGVQFSYDELTFVNLTLKYSYLVFGSFEPYLSTLFNGNLYKTGNIYTNKIITVRNIDQYQFKSKFRKKILFENNYKLINIKF